MSPHISDRTEIKMFFKTKLYKKESTPLFLGQGTKTDGVPEIFEDYIGKRLAHYGVNSGSGVKVESITFKLGFTASVKAKISAECEFSKSDEAYAIVLDKSTKIYAKKPQGFLFAVSTLCQLADFGELYRGFVYDYPISATRGYRTYLPSRAGIEDFKKMIDFLVYYKYNKLDLEIGGAMEYKRHPEINKAWKEFCDDVHRYSGRAHEIQLKTYQWEKNSIHCDNAEGDILTQDECRDIAEYCRSRGIEIVPECPTYSHSDYIVMAHPEIREREGDMHPDTYCSCHPDTYKYVFDVLEEVIEVFKPETINIGHDEMYSIGICPRCKGTPAPVLYANDVIKIYNFLKEKGIKTMMWGEKLLKSFTNESDACGGSGHGKGSWRVPALYPCRDLLPKDITYLHWYWCFNHNYDRVYHDRGMKVLYGNLSALSVKHWNLRRDWGIGGGFVSNWGSFNEEYMQRNCQYLDLISSAYAFWCEDFEERRDSGDMLKATMAEAYRIKASKTKNPLKVTHTTTYDIPYKFFYDGEFIVDEVYMLGHYELTYSDGTLAALPVKFGTNIGCADFVDAAHQHGFLQLSYGTLPKKRGAGYAYETVYENPYPEKKLTRISYVPLKDKEDAVVELLGFEAEKNIDEIYTEKRTLGAEKEFAMDGDKV